MRPDPIIVKNLFNQEDFTSLLTTVLALDKSKNNQTGFGRFGLGDDHLPVLAEYAEKILPKVQEVFNSKTLKHTYTLFCNYQGSEAKLLSHKDNNACTYTFDLCLYYKVNWGLFVEGKEYFAEPNEAIAFYGNDQEHWRGPFPDPDNNYMGVIFFHYAEPDHWFFTKGRDYLLVVNGTMTEEEWLNSKK